MMISLTEQEIKGLINELMKAPAMYSLNSILFLNKKLEESKALKDGNAQIYKEEEVAGTASNKG